MKKASAEILDAKPPAKPEAEKALLGAIIDKPAILADAQARGIRLSSFYDQANQALFACFCQLQAEGLAIEPALYLPRMRDRQDELGIKAAAFIAEARREIQITTNWPSFVDEILKAAGQRQLRFTGESLIQASANGLVPGDVAEDAIRSLSEVKAGTAGTGKTLTYHRITCAELAAAEYNTEYLVEWTLVSGQPCIVAGPKKACKTTIIIDLAISLAIAGYFLGKFKVTRGCRVLLMTGESGLATVQETARRIAIAAGYQLADIEGLIISDQLPVLGSADHEAALRKMLTDDEIEVLILDPTYLCLNPDGDEGSLFAMGAMLRSIATLCAEMGVTLILVHHCKKGIADPFAPPELENIAWAGFQEFARQWLLLGRRERYEPGTGHHQLWLSVGGSAGHSALWGVDINEGAFDGTTPRHWQVDVVKAADAIAEAQQSQAEQRNEAATQRRTAILQADVEQLTKTLIKYRGGETKTLLRDQSGLRTERFNAALKVLIDDGKAEPVDITKGNGRRYDGYKPAGKPME